MDATKVMSVEVVTVPPELSLEAAHRMMHHRAIRHLPVVAAGRLVGMVSDRDVLLAIGRNKEGAYVYPKVTVGEVMSLSPISAGPSVSVGELAALMVDEKLDALPIVSDGDVLVGMVTSSDVLRMVTAWFPKETVPLAFQIRPISELQARA